MPQAASIEELLKSGAHFGHLTRRWNPKMKEFIFMQRNGIHIMDLKKTQSYLQQALDAVEGVARSGKTVLFVGTKKQAQETIKNEALRAGMPYVTHRWLGGMLTNFSTVRKSISRMEDIERMFVDGTADNLTKKERLMLDREKGKLALTLGGIAKMSRLPGALFVVDIIKESIAINEAINLGIPIFAIVDTNSDPDVPDFIIPCNDDSSRAVHLISSQIADAIIEGGNAFSAAREDEMMRKTGEEAEKSIAEAEESVDGDDAPKRRTRRRRKAD
jgi:small subunit ribosomal protein S2